MGLESTPLSKTTIILAGVGFLTFAIAVSMFKRRRNYVKNVAKVKKLIFYPIKSLQGIEVNELEVTQSGVRYGEFRDRSFILLDANNRMISQRQEPTLTLVKPKMIGPRELLVEADGREPLKINLAKSVQKTDTVKNFKIWGFATQGIDCGEEAAQWFSGYLGKTGIRLVQHVDELLMRPSKYENGTIVSPDNSTKIRFQDDCPFHLINEASIRDFNEKLSVENKTTDHRNWRPNILIGETFAYAEDDWKYIKVGDAEFLNVKSCERCTVTTVDPNNGFKVPDLLPIYEKIRGSTSELKQKLYENKALFGIMYHLCSSESKISVGDTLDAIDF